MEYIGWHNEILCISKTTTPRGLERTLHLVIRDYCIDIEGKNICKVRTNY